MAIKRRINLCIVSLIIAALSSFACVSRPDQQQAKEEPPPPQSHAPAEPQPLEKAPAPQLPPPTVEEARAAVARVYETVVRVDTFHNPFVIVGDFNGDQSQDIGVVVNPVKEKLGEINSEVANWMIKDPLADPAPETSQAQPAARPEVNEQDRLLLAVIHGYGSRGWRDPGASQTYLLKNAVGGDIRARPARSVPRPDRKPFPYIRGDVISQTLNSERGFIYYDGAKYVWYGPRSYRREVARRLPH